MMRELLASHSLQFRPENSLNVTSDAKAAEEAAIVPRSATVDVRLDPDTGHKRTFVDWSEFESKVWTNSESLTTEQTHPTPPARIQSVPGDSWAALDFILALEHVCQGHMVHPHINPNAVSCDACSEFGLHGHALTGTAKVYQSALPPQQGDRSYEQDSRAKWQLPHSEIDKLVKMSENLPLDDEWLTPAQAYSAV